MKGLLDRKTILHRGPGCNLLESLSGERSPETESIHHQRREDTINSLHTGSMSSVLQHLCLQPCRTGCNRGAVNNARVKRAAHRDIKYVGQTIFGMGLLLLWILTLVFAASIDEDGTDPYSL